MITYIIKDINKIAAPYMDYYFGSHLTTRLCISVVTWLAALAIEGQSLGNGIIGGIILTSSIAINLLKNIKQEKITLQF